MRWGKVVPVSRLPEVLEYLHLESGHGGRDKMEGKAQEEGFWWPGEHLFLVVGLTSDRDA